MSKLLFMLFFCLVPISFQAFSRSKCYLPEIEHGYVRRGRGARLARFSCNEPYELVGNKYATCRLGHWDVPLPVCVRPGCVDLEIKKGMTIPTHRGAWMIFYCFPGYKLAGSTALYCDGYRWNATTPKCVPEKGSEPPLSCDFESEDLCGWRQDELHDFDWTRLNTKTPSAFLLTGPSYDHTLGKGGSGYYMFIESTSKLTNDSARLISPIYDGSLTKKGCFSFFYHMYGKSIGGLRVYQIPEGLHQMHGNITWSDQQDYLLFEKWGDHGDFWFRNVSKLNDTAGNFQIVIEGIRGTSFTSDIAIDDVAILQGTECDAAVATAVTPAEFSETCAGRCDMFGKAAPGRSCACSATCINDENCCPDFFELCVYNNAGQQDDDNTTTDQPLTEKLIRITSTPATTTSTSRRTTKTQFATPTIALSETSIPPNRPTAIPTTPTNATTTTRAPTSTISTTTRTTTRRSTVRHAAKTTPTRQTVPPRPTTARPVPTTRAPTTRKSIPSSTRKSITLAPTRTPPRIPQKTTSSVQSEAAKAHMEQAIQVKKVVAEKPASSSGATAAVLTTLFLSACVVLAALALRSARGRAALARLRGRVSDNPEVRYLTRDDD